MSSPYKPITHNDITRNKELNFFLDKTVNITEVVVIFPYDSLSCTYQLWRKICFFSWNVPSQRCHHLTCIQGVHGVILSGHLGLEPSMGMTVAVVPSWFPYKESYQVTTAFYCLSKHAIDEPQAHHVTYHMTIHHVTHHMISNHGDENQH